METLNSLPAHITEIIIAREKRVLADTERQTLEEYLELHPQKKPEIEAFTKIIRHGGYLQAGREYDQEKAWAVITAGVDQSVQKTHKIQRSTIVKRWLKYAAVLIPLIFALGFLYVHFQNRHCAEQQFAEVMTSVRQGRAMLVLGSGEEVVLDGSTFGVFIEKEGVQIHKESKDRISYSGANEASMHSLIVPRGGEYQLVLPDGSLVYINSDSRLEYPTLFDIETREVTLSGEAYFEVTPDPDRPFIVKTPGMKITVTGTSFNVYNYPGDIAEATLVQGAVMVTSVTCPGIKLQPGQQAIMRHEQDAISVKYVDTKYYTSWVHGFFSFRDMALKDLARRMERWYDVDIEFADESSESVRLTGAMDKDKSFEDLVWLIGRSASVSFDVVDNKTVISMK